MENQSGWRASIAIACYVTLIAGILVGSIIVALILVGFGTDFQKLSFPASLISLPITEGIILGITLLFAKYKGANLQKLGLKKPSPKTIIFVSVTAVLLIILAGTISIFEETVLGPDPMAQDLLTVLLPRDPFQLILLIGLSIFLVGPAEELAFRGFIQRGLENSFGKMTGLLIASLMFGVLHGLNSLRAIIPVTVISLILGYVWQKTDGNTTACAWMHGLYDAVTITLAYAASVSV
jgi:membrane protease YdiL (CAAX protease family)